MHSPTKFYLYRRSNSYYYIAYFDVGCLRWKSTKAKRKAEALRALSDFRNLLKTQSRPRLLSTFIRGLLEVSEATYAKSTQDIYRIAFSHLLGISGDIPLSSITPQHFAQYQAERAQHVKPATVHAEQRALKTAFNKAVGWNLLERSPFARAKLITLAEEAPSFFTKEDFQRLLSTIEAKWLREVVVFAAVTGLRRGELLNLRWRDVDLPRRSMNIQSNATYRTKQGKRRGVPLNNMAISLLQSRHGKNTSPFVFTLNDVKIVDSWLSHAFKKAVRAAKLENGNFHFHSLRHTFASWLVQDGASLYEVQKLLGHSSSRVTEVYSHLQPEQMHATVNRIDVTTQLRFRSLDVGHLRAN